MLPYLLLLVPLPPLGGFMLLALDPWRLGRARTVLVALASGCLPAMLLIPLVSVCGGGACGGPIAPIFTLMVGEYEVAMALGLDGFSAIAAITVAIVAACVMLYSVDYMRGSRESELRRFFALLNLFVAAMLAMVLAADSVTLFLGWELMGLCSFFLIAYNMTSQRAYVAGRKAFIMTRIADAALLAGLLLLFLEAGTIRLETLIPSGAAIEGQRAPIIAALLLIGALGKSAQLPFQTWLPTAMAGPTPVSALLHSATMVAAGAVLLSRFAPVIEANPSVAAATAISGVATTVFGAVCAIAQKDVKRLLAYSSISQIGMMVVAVGVGAPEVAMAHFVVHAAFKSLLFMASGVMAKAAGGDTSIAALAGARHNTPVAFWTFTAGAACLAGLPLLTAGWYSKEAILGAAFAAGSGGMAVWLVALVSAALTGVYAFRPVFAAMQAQMPRDGTPGRPMHESMFTTGPLTLLAGASILGGLAVEPIIAALDGHAPHPPLLVELLGAAAALLGVYGAWQTVMSPRLALRIARARKLRAGFQMDARYYVTFVRPYRRLVRALTRRQSRFVERLSRPPDRAMKDPFAEARWTEDVTRPADGSMADPVGEGFVAAGLWLHRAITAPLMPDRFDKVVMRSAHELDQIARRARRLQTGRVRDYALALVAGLALLVILAWGTAWL